MDDRKFWDWKWLPVACDIGITVGVILMLALWWFLPD